MALALTFDDGPGRWTAPLLDVLKNHQCRVTFFLLGANILRECEDSDFHPRETIVRILQEGHLVGNHTMTHTNHQTLLELRKEIEMNDALLRELYHESGVPCPKPIPYRLPFGIRTFVAGQRAALDNRLQALASMGWTHVHWTSILPDWEAVCQDDADCLVTLAIKHISEMTEQGLDVVFAMHDASPPGHDGPRSRKWTVYAVDKILSYAKQEGITTFQVPQVGY